ncbi:MAG: hypothetical protein J0H82_27220 [Alphaproteobacteria bacterium]|jgi:hypothetical protein|nr:hypothetical protein [Alphaproteobacteria bacterium]
MTTTSEADSAGSALPPDRLGNLEREMSLLRELLETVVAQMVEEPSPRAPRVAVRDFSPAPPNTDVASFIRLHEARQQVIGPKLLFELQADEVDIISLIDRKLTRLAQQILAVPDALLDARAAGRLRDLTNCALRDAAAKRGLWELLGRLHDDAAAVDDPSFMASLEASVRSQGAS